MMNTWLTLLGGMTGNGKEKQNLPPLIFGPPFRTQGRKTVKPETIKAIESILSKGDRAEVIPTKEGVKVVRIRRDPVK